MTRPTAQSTGESVIPPMQPVEDFATGDHERAAGASVADLRSQILASRAGRQAFETLGGEIAGHIERKRFTLAQVRRAVGLTQEQLADDLGMTQSEASKLERRSNPQLATLARFIEATGGRLRLVATYNDTEVELDLDLDQLSPSS